MPFEQSAANRVRLADGVPQVAWQLLLRLHFFDAAWFSGMLRS